MCPTKSHHQFANYPKVHVIAVNVDSHEGIAGYAVNEWIAGYGEKSEISPNISELPSVLSRYHNLTLNVNAAMLKHWKLGNLTQYTQASDSILGNLTRHSGSDDSRNSM